MEAVKMSGSSAGTHTAAHAKTAAVNGISIALVFLATAFINIRLPIAANGGLIHLGNVPLFLAAAIFGKRTGAVCGAFGMGLFDLLSGWTLWAPFTFVIAGLIGYTVGRLTEDPAASYPRYVLAVILALIIKVAGYYIAEAVIYGNLAAPLASIPGNVIQIGVASAVFLIVIKPIRAGLKAF